jgi:hypothetical protein
MTDLTGQVLDKVYMSLLLLIPPTKDSGFYPLHAKQQTNYKSCLK